MMPLMFKQLEEFAARPGKAAFFRETGAEHKNVDERSAEGGFLEVRIAHRRNAVACKLTAARRRARWVTQTQAKSEAVSAGSARRPTKSSLPSG